MPNLAVPAALALAVLAGPALAGPAADRAQAHFEAIARGDVAAIAAAYGPEATLNWIGGPLDGTYAGPDRMREVWAKFAKAQGPLMVATRGVQESTNPKGATVTANVVFAGKNEVPVRHVLVYRGDRLVGEVWQVDPSLAAY